MHAKFRQNRTIFNFQTVCGTVHLKNKKLSDFDETWRAYCLKYVDFEIQKKILKKLIFWTNFFPGGCTVRVYILKFWYFFQSSKIFTYLEYQKYLRLQRVCWFYLVSLISGYWLHPCALCSDQKYFGYFTFSLKVFIGASLNKIGDFELPRYFVAYKDSLLI